MKMKTLAFILLTSMGCTTANNTNTENTIVKSEQAQEQTQEIEIEELIVKRKFDIAEDEMDFKIRKIQLKENLLEVRVSYGGGCVDPHVFELYTTGKTDSQGVLDFTLLHKTKGDLCKMMLMQYKIYDISKMTKRKNFVSYRINGGEIQTVEKAN